jgi:hypothetical protein
MPSDPIWSGGIAMPDTQNPRSAPVKGTCTVCGKPAPDSVICDDCFLERVVKPTMTAIRENRDA